MHRWIVTDCESARRAAGEAARLLRAGGVVVIPTETYYGLAADATCVPALQRVLSLKARKATKPLLLLVKGLAMARRIVPEAPDVLERIAARFWPGPLTVLVQAPSDLPAPLRSASGTVALRHSSHGVVRALIDALAGPITGTSANVSGQRPASEPTHVRLVEQADGLIDAGATPGGRPSTILDLTREPPRVVRVGAVPRSALSEELGPGLL